MTEIPALLAMASRAVTDQLHARLAEEGFSDLRPAHGFAFQFLSWRDGATAVELGQHLGVTKQAAVQLVDELEKRGYVQRRPHPTDRRARLVVLTQRGWDAIRRVIEIWQEIEERWALAIGPDRLEQLRTDLQTYVASVSPGDGPPSIRPVW